MNTHLGNRILIIGSGGSGKSTLASQLHDLLELPLIHLDSQFWNAGWVETPKDVWLEKLKAIVSADQWIIDGNYGGSLDIRLERADTVIFLDFDRTICICRVLKRWRKHKNSTRPDMADGCPEKVDFSFLKWVWNFKKNSRPQVIEKLASYPNVRQLILHNPKEVKQFIAQVKRMK